MAQSVGKVLAMRRRFDEEGLHLQLRTSAVIHGEAMKAARDEVPEYVLERLAKVADGNDRLRTVTAGEIAGAWMASPASHQGYELIAAGLLLITGPVDGDQLIEGVRVGYERGKGSLQGYDPTDATG